MTPKRNTINISLPAPMRKWVEAQVRDGDFGTTSEYIRHVLRKEREGLESALEESLDGPAVEMNAAEWRRLHAEIRRGATNRKTPKTRRKSA